MSPCVIQNDSMSLMIARTDSGGDQSPPRGPSGSLSMNLIGWPEAEVGLVVSTRRRWGWFGGAVRTRRPTFRLMLPMRVEKGSKLQ